jgi:hypothetical protein
MMGRILIKDDGDLSGGEKRLDTSGLSTGAYVLSLEINGRFYRRVLIRN